jgi:hypothetical protein
MVERGNGAGLPVEAMEAVGVVRGRVGKQLERHLPPQARVAGAVHLAHAALAEGRDDLVGAELISGDQCHWA